jgi:Na+/melibiose symporter-like transporter
MIPLVAAFVQAGVFFVVESRLETPLVPLEFFQSRDLLGANLTAFLLAAASPSMVLMLTFYMQQTLQFSPIKTGFAFLPQATVAFTATRVVSRLVGRLGARRIILLGSALLAAGLLTYTALGPASDYSTGILPGMLLAPVGTLFGFISAMIVATTGVPHRDQGIAAGMLTSSQQIGAAVGVSTIIYIIGARGEAAGTATAEAAANLTTLPYGFAAAALFAALAFLAAMLVIRPAGDAATDDVDDAVAAAVH